jgi:hypothetical protein
MDKQGFHGVSIAFDAKPHYVQRMPSISGREDSQFTDKVWYTVAKFADIHAAVSMRDVCFMRIEGPCGTKFT